MNSRFALPLFLLGAPLASQHHIKAPATPPPMVDADQKTPAPILPAKPAPAGQPTDPLAPPAVPQAKPVAARVGSQSRLPEDMVLVDRPGDGKVWARARNYKASFDGAGATYIPFLGSDAPRNFPVAFTLRSVRVGSEIVDFKAEGDVTDAGHRISIDRGALVETYDLSAGAMEQSFAFKTLPAGGDLVIGIGVTTELVATAAADGLCFGNDLGQVRYGAAVIVDANGRKAPMQSTFDDGAIQLRAPSGFLATAAFPVVVDPLVTTFPVRRTTVSEFASDIAYDLSQSQYLIVWEEAFSVTDHDIGSVRQDRNGNQIFASAAYIDQTSTTWSHPRVANLRVPHRFLVVGERGTPPTREVWGRTREAGSSFMSTQFAISVNAGAGDKFNPDVGGDASDTGPVYWAVVWERTYAPGDSDIHAQLVDEMGGLHGTMIPLANSYNTHETHPAISKSDGSNPRSSQNWTVVWQYTYAPGDEDIWFARIKWDGVVTTSATVLDNDVTNTTNPAVSSPTDDDQGRRWLACYEFDIGPTQRDIMCALYNGPWFVKRENLSYLDSPSESVLDQLMPHVDCDGCRFTVAWVEPYTVSGTDYDVRCSTYHVVYGTSIGVTEARIPLGYTAEPEQQPRVAATRSAGARDHRYGATWSHLYGPFDYDIEGAVYEGVGLGGFTTLPTGCAGVGMATSGGTALGDTAGLQMTGVGANVPVMMFSLRLNPTVSVCSSCVLGVRLDTASFTAGGSLSLPIPCEGAFVGGVVAVQGLTYGVGPCVGGSIALSDTALLRIR